MKRKISLFLTLLLLVLTASAKTKAPKYVFYFIGDGMGVNQVMATQYYLSDVEGKLGFKSLCFTDFPYSGLVITHSANNYVTDSAAAGTALAAGNPYYASRIIRYREQLGGYVRINQILEVEGLPDSLMKWFFLADSVPFRKIQVNTESVSSLRKHPYLDFYQARAIVEFRRDRGNIKGPEQLSFLEEFTDQDLVRLNPYLDYR